MSNILINPKRLKQGFLCVHTHMAYSRLISTKNKVIEFVILVLHEIERFRSRFAILVHTSVSSLAQYVTYRDVPSGTYKIA